MFTASSILLADCHREQLFRLESLLGEHYTVHDATNAHDVLDFLESGCRVDLVLMSADLPIMDGFETCQRIKANPLTTNIPVVVLIDESAADYREAGTKAGVDGFIRIPWLAETVLEYVETLLDLRTKEMLSDRMAEACRSAATSAHESGANPSAFKPRDAFASFGYSEHDEVSLLLPWYLNGSLDESEVQLVDSHLQNCVACRGEIRELTEMATAIAADPEDDPAGLAARASFDRLCPSLKSARLGRPARPAAMLRRAWQHSYSRRSAIGLAMAASLMLMLTPIVLKLQSQPESPQYMTLASSKSPNSGEQLQIVFAPDLEQAQRDSLLAAVNGELVGDANSVGAYKVRLGHANSAAAEASAIAYLRQQPGVLLVEPVEQPHP